ncbi:ADP-ribosylglycohydrolase family protein [Serratia aquatilis]|uniref:ADP-ribosylglycohydrolase family protein n=1 Tax=Serratia aquatilis TaxID=1737515 RepID=A0ABV6EH28_9GAMM
MKIKQNSHHAILGALYGQAIGDAMGMPSELWPLQQVRDYFGWITHFLPGPEENIAANGFVAGEFTDDTQQAVALMDALLAAKGQVEPERIAHHIMLWAERVGAFDKNILGPSSKAALLAFRAGTPLAEIPANGVTNGAAMRVAPLGCMLPSGDLPGFIEAVRLSCSPTHKSDIAVAGAFAIAWAISRAIEGADWVTLKHELPTRVEQVQQQKITTFSPSLSRRLVWAIEFASSLSHLQDSDALAELYHTIGAGMDNIESIPMALALVELAGTDPKRCAVLAANLGGDTDTIGAMATAICGALHGIDAFPAEWIDKINRANQIDFQPYAEALLSLRQQE